MEREGLTAQRISLRKASHSAQNYQKFDDDLLWYTNRLRDTHDMYHILTGYGRDALGEDALLGYTHSQHGGLGIRFIAYMGNRVIAKEAPKRGPRQRCPRRRPDETVKMQNVLSNRILKHCWINRLERGTRTAQYC